ncbi:type 1 glutamine amidotransferase [Devosia rhodophyticola]|uniref:Type 1 glutamine amidotransferase n=1 Tax=Devosia rhodophyticola TaxID=3026423 RepID=A0ABY7YZP1_9HYPH|nr:type 1 glutamine amidotransferase [Devosia rhodophyticola]WDR06727.1 type 1 glutamine amidotransferase [Devosia rhodophyticola]
MQITIIQTGQVPPALADTFEPYPQMFEAMFDGTGAHFDFETIAVHEGAPLPDPVGLAAIVITGSSAGVYDDLIWMAPLRQFIRDAYAAGTRMVGICFGHQIMADALGGDVGKSEKGWGLGRHTYAVTNRPDFMADAPQTLAIACSHQDQVKVPPAAARVIMASDFTPNAGLMYENGAALSFQPHPEFDNDFMLALAALRRGQVPDQLVEAAEASVSTPSDSKALAGYIATFLTR